MSEKTKARVYKGGASTKPKRSYAERKGLFMTDEEVADELAVTTRMVEKLVRRGDLQRVKVSSLNRIPRASLDAYIARVTGAGR